MTVSPSKTSRRRRASRVLAAGIVAFVAVTLGFVVARPRPAAYVPGAEAEGSDEITRTLDRGMPASSAPRQPRDGSGTQRAGVAASSRKPDHTAAVSRGAGAHAAGDGPEGVVFTERAEAAGLRFVHFQGERSSQLPEDMGSGLAWGDYDGDGDSDLFIVNVSGPLTLTAAETARSPATAKLYRNDGAGRFSDVTGAAGLAVRGCGMGAAWGDYDGDGDLDLFVARYGTNLLFRNDGGRFTDVSDDAGVSRWDGFWAGASWADYDRDGDLDLYVCGYVRYAHDPAAAARSSLQFRSVVPFTLNPSSYPPEANLLLRNDGGAFRETAQEAGVANPKGRSLSATWCDFDGDGWPDLYVANDVSDNAMFHNLGDGRFRDISHSAWVADYRGAMGLAVGDWENDGDFDVFVTHWMAQENALYVNETSRLKVTPEAPLRFVDQADLLGLGQIALDAIGWGVSLFDWDNDGRLDLHVANGSTFQDESDPTRLLPMRSFLFWNAGEHGFYEVAKEPGGAVASPSVARGSSVADYDGDGDLDVAVVVHGGPARLFRNDGGNRGGWLRVLLRSTAHRARGGADARRSTTFATGALVRLTAGGLTQIREVGGGSSYLSQEPPGEVFFGVGDVQAIDRLEIRWPSGVVQKFDDLPPRSTLRVVEGDGSVAVTRTDR
jgi:hypothetical protein